MLLAKVRTSPRHPPAHARNLTVILADGEGIAVFQHAIGQRLCRGGPDPPDDGKADFHDRALVAELFQRGRRIAKIGLAGEVHARRHAMPLLRFCGRICTTHCGNSRPRGSAFPEGEICVIGTTRGVAISRHDLPEVLQSHWPSRERAQGKPGANCTRSLVCRLRRANERSHYRFSQSSRLSPRNGFTASFVLSPVSGLFCHRSCAGLTTQFDARVAAPGPHDFAVRCSVLVRRENPPDAAASIASRANVP